MVAYAIMIANLMWNFGYIVPRKLSMPPERSLAPLTPTNGLASPSRTQQCPSAVQLGEQTSF